MLLVRGYDAWQCGVSRARGMRPNLECDEKQQRLGPTVVDCSTVSGECWRKKVCQIRGMGTWGHGGHGDRTWMGPNVCGVER